MSAPLVISRIGYATNLSSVPTGTANGSDAFTPPSAVAGDLLVWVGVGRLTTGSPPASGTGGQTWTQLQNTSANPRQLNISYAVFDGSWSGSLAGANSVSPGTNVVLVYRAAGSGVTWGLATKSGPTGVASSGTHTIVGATPSHDEAMMLAVAQSAFERYYTVDTASGFSALSANGFRNTSGDDNCVMVLDRSIASPVATGNVVLTVNSAAPYTHTMVELWAEGEPEEPPEPESPIVVDTPGEYEFTVPEDYEGWLKVTVDGAGASSYHAPSSPPYFFAGGGAGARAISYLAVSGGEVFTASVGAGGPPSWPATDGETTQVADESEAVVASAEGGFVPVDAYTGGIGGRTSECIGDEVWPGGDGHAPTNPDLPGPTGGGPAGDGGDAPSGAVGGAGGYWDGADIVDATDGESPGAGGGGLARAIAGRIGGGGHGRVMFEWGEDIEPPGDDIEGSGAATIGVSCSGLGALALAAVGAATIAVSSIGSGGLAIQGSGAATIPVVGAGLGSLAIDATGAASIAVSGEALGALLIHGAGSATVSVVCSGIGGSTATGVGAAVVPVVGAGAGALAISGAGSAAVPVSGEGTGQLHISAVGDATIAVVCSGVGGGAPHGQGAATISVVCSGSGALLISASGTGQVEVTSLSAGHLAITGSGAASIGVTGVGLGSGGTGGVGLAHVAVTGAGLGSLLIAAHAASPITVTCLGHGELAILGTGDATVIVVGTGAQAPAFYLRDLRASISRDPLYQVRLNRAPLYGVRRIS